MEKDIIIKSIEPAVRKRGCFIVDVTVSNDNDIVLTVEKEVVVYVFADGNADMSEMRYRLNDLTYSVTANVPAQTMVHTANQIEKA